MKLSNSQKRLYQFLIEKEQKNTGFSFEEALTEIGWKPATLSTYLNKGQLSDFITKDKDGFFHASNALKVTETQFAKILSQSKHRRGLGHTCDSLLAKALLRKSKENILLALELYTRPALENRTDAFTVLFCIAWEQLLKAIIIEQEGEYTIFKISQPGKKIRETVSLKNCLEFVFEANSLTRRNIERIAYYRDQAVHLLIPELQGAISRLFQSGILNYLKKFEEFAKQRLIDGPYNGFLSPLGDLNQPSIVALSSSYGEEVAKEIFQLILELNREIEEVNNIEFAVPIKVHMVYAKEKDGSYIKLSKAENGIEGLKSAMVTEKPNNNQKTYPS